MQLNETLGSVEYDRLLSTPSVQAVIGVAELDEAATEAVRGTLLAFAEAGGPLTVYDGTGTPSAILAEDANGETIVKVYKQGTFNISAVTVADDYTITEADEDTLRKYDIFFDKEVY